MVHGVERGGFICAHIKIKPGDHTYQTASLFSPL
jgi:hypothetical protein